jgi:hypothetical protein
VSAEVLELITPAVKRLATLRAALAIKGHQVHELASGTYLVTWMNCARHCGDLDALADFARQVGAVR